MHIAQAHTLSSVAYINRMFGPISQDLIEIGSIERGWAYLGIIEGGTTGYEATYDSMRDRVIIREVYRPDSTAIAYPLNDLRDDFPQFIEWAGRDFELSIPTMAITHRS